MGSGSPNKQDSSDAHGSPLGESRDKTYKAKFGLAGRNTFLYSR
ncbi:MAG: hypothetical protein IPH11_12530 [Ignavibacteriales bacterium]|nr:hypothetical protein [Ignavibacteriales bacterium]